jgi:hypothetical protein
MEGERADWVGELIAEYRQVEPGAEGQSWRRCEIIDELLDLEDGRVLPFILGVISDEADFYLARTSALKFLPGKVDHWRPTQEERARAAAVIVRVMLHDPNDLVRDYAALALWPFRNQPGVLPAVLSVIEAEQEETNLLYNAFSMLFGVAATFTKECLDALAFLRRHPVLGPTAERTLERYFEIHGRQSSGQDGEKGP